MTKRIIFCADGTWNGPDEETKASVLDGDDRNGEFRDVPVTNVVKLFSNLAGRVTPETMALPDEQEKVVIDAKGNVVQIAKYMHGVGHSKNLLLKLLGGVLGAGIIMRIVRGYTFISRHYEPGDEIHILGFSRGAYTARALAGMITKVGLLNPAVYDVKDKETAYRLGLAAWCKSKSVSLHGTGKLTELGNSVLNVIQGFFGRALKDDGLLPNIKIKSVAVWDTVGSLGIPLYAADSRFDVYRFTDEALSEQVENGFHAMAIDEMRLDFPITKWNARAGVTQVWFLGAHADVGGGYGRAESGLSDIALQWMMQKLTRTGVSFATPLTYEPTTDSFIQPIHTPWKDSPFKALLREMRKIDATDLFHNSVSERWRQDEKYRPDALGPFKPAGPSRFE
jgi:uncharacterized protein (DUF2235 family)